MKLSVGGGSMVGDTKVWIRISLFNEMYTVCDSYSRTVSFVARRVEISALKTRLHLWRRLLHRALLRSCLYLHDKIAKLICPTLKLEILICEMLEYDRVCEALLDFDTPL